MCGHAWQIVTPDTEQEFVGITFRFVAKYVRQLGRAADVAAVQLLRNSIALWRFVNVSSGAFANNWASGPIPPAGAPLSLSGQTSGLIATLEWTQLVCDGLASD